MSKGSNVPTVGPVNISWYAGTPAPPRPVSSSVSPGAASSGTPDTHMIRPSSPEQPTIPPLNQEEEVVASGWGGDGDGEDGMGML